MFCDLVDSTRLSSQLDPEDYRDVVRAYHTACTEVIRRYDGHIAQLLGDGLLVYFGYPQAHEDDAERAVRAGLALVIAVNALKTRAPLQTRIGIATGLVVVGDLIGAGESQERGVIAESTRKLLGNLFELEALDAKNLKGIVEPVRAWAALRPSSVESRFEALHAAGLTALVGREEELELLLRRWSRAKNGEGQVVLLGEQALVSRAHSCTT
jgi:class 3 adenylate cyclase